MTLQTTGTVSTVAYDTRTVLDRAYGALGLTPQQITGEKIQIALDLLSLTMTDLVNTANPLWCLENVLVTMVQGQRAYTLPPGTNDVQSAYWRTSNNVTPATVSSSTSAYAFDFGLNSSGTNNDTSVVSWSINWTTASIPLTFQSSEDNATWITAGSTGLTQQGLTGVVWYDMSNTNAQRYWRVIPATSYNGATITPANTLAGINTSTSPPQVYNTPNALLMYRMNRDDYFTLVNRFIPGRPVQYWLNRKLAPTMEVWEVPDSVAVSQNGVFEVRRQRLIQDVGSLQQAIEVPTRWFYTIIFVLADALAFCTPEAKPDRIALVQARAQQMLKTVWTEERDKSPFKMQFNIRAYTR